MHYDINLIEPKLLSTVEVDWLNTYHAWVLKSLEKNLEKTERAWLQKATKRIKAGARGA